MNRKTEAHFDKVISALDALRLACIDDDGISFPNFKRLVKASSIVENVKRGAV